MDATLVAPHTTPRQDWFASWFDSEHYHALYAHRDEQEAAGFVDALLTRHRLTDGANVLDLGCGTGRHSRYLASKGFDVTGLDLSAESLRRARASVASNLRFVRQDMRLPFGAGSFDHVLSLFTSFGYFDDPADHVTVIHNIARSLKPGGTVVLDYMNARQVEGTLRREERIVRDGVVYLLSRWTDSEHIIKRIVIEDGRTDRRLEYFERVARLSVADFQFMFAVCDMKIEAAFGDYQLSPFDLQTSPRLILVAKKRDSAFEAALPPRQVLANAAYGLRRHAEIGREHRLRHAERN